MKTFLTLDVVGFLVAVVMGVLIFLFGGGEGLQFLLVILLFLVASALVTRFEKGRKIRLHTYEDSRGWRNVIANGIVPLVIAFFYFLNTRYALVPGPALIVAYVASIAAITADKFSSEIGVLDNRAVMLLTLRRTRPGVSGGVSAMGVAAGALGAFVIGLGLFSFSDFPLLIVIVLVAGLLGDLADSLLGYFEEKGVGNKYTSNLVCAVVGGLLGLLFFIL